MPSTDRKLELKARHRWLRPSHRRLCINRPSKLSRLTEDCVGERVKENATLWCYLVSKYTMHLLLSMSGFGGLVVSMLASGTQDRGSKPGRSRWIFSGVKKY
jgi:hypothetical protein